MCQASLHNESILRTTSTQHILLFFLMQTFYVTKFTLYVEVFEKPYYLELTMNDGTRMVLDVAGKDSTLY